MATDNRYGRNDRNDRGERSGAGGQGFNQRIHIDSEKLFDRLPDDYLNLLKGGYFEPSKDGSGVKKIRSTYIADMAQNIAKSLRVHNSQLRKFFDYCRNLEEKLRLCRDYDLIETDILKLIPFAADAKSKRNITQLFYDFIEQNVHAIKNEDDFKKGFMQHFEAIVAFSSLNNPRSR